jgi:hypothetical protein
VAARTNNSNHAAAARSFARTIVENELLLDDIAAGSDMGYPAAVAVAAFEDVEDPSDALAIDRARRGLCPPHGVPWQPVAAYVHEQQAESGASSDREPEGAASPPRASGAPAAADIALTKGEA